MTDSDDEFMIFPITDLDANYDASQSEQEDSGGDHQSSDDDERPKVFMSLRQRRLSKVLGTNPLPVLQTSILPPVPNVNKLHWLSAIKKAKEMQDPWEVFHIEDMKVERCTRHRYNAIKKTWVQDEVNVKIQDKSFTRGAMRQCFRLKKQSTFSHKTDWKHAFNYVAKSYIEKVDREVYFEDVKLQMDAKLWGEEYNRHNPPKKVDIFQMYILEFKARKGSPLFHLEHFIEGDYVKYNSNSGFVEETIRLTPQAFSHFTFERSGHQMIVVDVQGVGDLYTDPQIHTVEGKDYGDGNLGCKGMALFFHSHVCNTICHSLGLSEFDLSANELNTHKDFLAKQIKFAQTRVRGKEEFCISPSPKETINITQLLRQRSISSSGSHSDEPSSPTSNDDPMSVDSPVGRVRLRFVSESDSVSMNEEEDREAFSRAQAMHARPSCVNMELDLRKLSNLRIGDSVLGDIHHEMAKYHELGRFTMNENEIDWESAIYHEEHAAQLGVLEAILTLAKLYLGIQRDVLCNCFVEPSSENIDQGVDYMAEAAEAGDRSAMIFMAKAFETGINLGVKRSISWEDSVHYYDEAAAQDTHDEGGEYDAAMDDPVYILKAKQAELLRSGGNGLDKNPERAAELYNEAADEAMAAMKGRLATKYYEMSEECYGEMEE
ncbi:eukaryotic elongation factor 2 kinase-like [Haliotis rufescens]|uniref:eukaryotic elongation factor 2 kinase-like n=1 Tax=Haliotis rufescens TaxID=6454 RepID=UPI001EB048CB|nr:eukaryotic elongation factor 2 kinase-like [Haliotis rufescens]XP_046380335.1 eukaryotic elongation factor 2 kinase-like [Haliotis rufescens]